MNLPDPPSDSITDIKVQEDKIHVSSFDRTLRIYKDELLVHKIVHNLPILKIGFLDNDPIFTDIVGDVITPYSRIKTDCGGIQGMSIYNNSIIVAGWNKKLQIIQNDEIQSTVELREKVYAMDRRDNFILLGCSNSTCLLYDIRKIDSIMSKSVAGPITSVALGNCAVIGMLNGKIRIDFSISGTSRAVDTYTFNCHHKSSDNKRINYPVNDLIFNNTLISCGSDGSIVKWDVHSRTMLKEIYRSDLNVSAIERYKNKIVAGFSYNYEQGDKESFSPELRILNV
ncbi:Mitotic spindle checkpoint protein BUB3, WD repeat superfamily [Trachipleistophora hominis]|uniref:Mitotic spindle checkpoint protein BUB3, WD repeat superfamily n=1 Tax=Trachipleistophora hominis TaxID=72359 RepID=L7JXU4_TRAHO|nr:Mitotic spindle checkpoint protein BUB3, WD repeat superfamily [Trachipleistophora hominis]